MIRLTLLWLFIAYLGLTAWKDWYKSLCGLVVLTAFIEHPDMPRTIMNIPGLNPWNFLLMLVVMSWLAHRKREKLRWDMPRGVKALLVVQLLLFTAGFARIFFDATGMEELQLLKLYGQDYITKAGLMNSYFINMLKWLLPGLLLFVGCNSRPRLMMALFALLAMYLVLAVLVVKAVPLGKIVSVESLTKGSLKIDHRVGYHRVDLSAMLAGASWALFAMMHLIEERRKRFMLFAAAGVIILGQALTGGRAGYLAWCMIGLFFGVFRWRKTLIAVPLVVVLLMTFIPQIRDRVLVGIGSGADVEIGGDFGPDGPDYEIDVKKLGAGRDGMWWLTFEKFKEAPWLGYGRLAVQRTGVVRNAKELYGEFFGHPHNAYLEMLIDNGIIGLGMVLLFYLAVARRAFSLLRDKSSNLYVAIGGVAMALVLAQLITSMTAQSFYPRQGVMGMWCAMGIMLRVWVEREKARRTRGDSPVESFSPVEAVTVH